MIFRELVIFFATVMVLCAVVPFVQAAGPQWTVTASQGVDLSSVAISADGSTIVAGGDQLIVLSPDGDRLWTGWSGTAVDLSGDGSYILTAQGTSVRLFNRAGTKLWDQYFGTAVADVSIAPDATLIAAGGGGTIETWYNSGVGLGINTTGVPADTVRHVRISPAKDQVIVTTSGALRSFNISCVQNWYNDTISPDLVEMSADGNGFVIPVGNHVRLYHSSGTRLWDTAIPGGNVISLAYSRDGSTIIVGRDDGTTGALDANGTILWVKKTGYWATSVGVSANGSVIAVGSLDKNLYMFDRKGDLLGSYQASGPIHSNSVAVSGDGSLIVVVDGSDVYGFSTPQLPGAVVPGGTSAVAATSPAPAATPDLLPYATPGESVSPARQAATVSQLPATTQGPGFPWGSAVLSIALVALVRIMRR